MVVFAAVLGIVFWWLVQSGILAELTHFAFGDIHTL